MLARVTHAELPRALVTRSVQAGGAELLWLGRDPIAVACTPARARGELKLLVTGDPGGELRQHGRRAVLARGAFTWLDTDAPFELVLPPGPRLVVRLSASEVRTRHPAIDVATAVARGPGHAGERVMAGVLDQLAHDGPALSDASGRAALNMVIEAIGLGAHAPAHDVARLRAERALASIAQRLADPSLDPDAVARDQGVSRRYLDAAVLGATGRSLAAHIRHARLARAAHELEACPDELAADIGRRWGFGDASHFTRRFRARYGVTPTAYRAQRRAVVAR